MSNSPYTPSVSYTFKVQSTYLSTTGVDGDRIEISETEFNGQEDTHMIADAVFEDGKWAWEDEKTNFHRYMSNDFAQAILDFLNSNPPPTKNPA